MDRVTLRRARAAYEKLGWQPGHAWLWWDGEHYFADPLVAVAVAENPSRFPVYEQAWREGWLVTPVIDLLQNDLGLSVDYIQGFLVAFDAPDARLEPAAPPDFRLGFEDGRLAWERLLDYEHAVWAVERRYPGYRPVEKPAWLGGGG